MSTLIGIVTYVGLRAIGLPVFPSILVTLMVIALVEVSHV